MELYFKVIQVCLTATLIWTLLIFLLLRFCPNDKIPLITNFFVKVLPKIPIVGIIEALKKGRGK